MPSLLPAEPETPPDASSRQGERQRALDVLQMHRLARRADGTAALVRWLARRTGCWVGVLDRSGTVLVDASPGPGPSVESLLSRGLDRMLRRDLPTFVESDGSGRSAVLLSVDSTGRSVPGPVLAFVGLGPVRASLTTDAATLIGTCWWAEQTQRKWRQVEVVEARCREAVMHLLVSRNLTTARQLASTLTPPLPDPVRVHIVECGADTRGEVIRRCEEMTDRSTWIVPCTIRSHHVIVVAKAARGVAPGGPRPLEVALVSGLAGCVVGTGDVMALRDAAVGYEQAFHALAVARRSPKRWARFDAELDLPTIVGPLGLEWATALLAPLITHVPARNGDPDVQELTATAQSWLSFSTGATRHLKIHRNTLSARLRRTEELLGLDLGRVDQQAILGLALRIRSTPHAPDASGPVARGSACDLDDLLRLTAVQRWAQAMLRPLHESAYAAMLESTLRAWLASDARISATAVTLGISVPGARKRVTRLEQIFRRSLLHAPSARHDLWLAVRAADLSSGTRGDG